MILSHHSQKDPDIIDFYIYQLIQNIAQQQRPSRPIIYPHPVYWIP